MSRHALGAVLDALAIEAPAAVARGRLALGRALGWAGTTAWPEIAWSFSDLAAGAPVEIVWRPGRPGLFWTAEPAAPEWPTPRRLTRALALARGMGARFDAQSVALARAALDASTAHWPVWLAGRHDGHGDAAKLYVRTGATVLGHAALRNAAQALRGDDRIAMLGLSPDGGMEVYWRRWSRMPGDLWQLSQHAEMALLANRLDAALSDWTGYRIDEAGGGSLGFSLKLSADGTPMALSAFLRMRQAGGDAEVHKRLLAADGDFNPALGRLWTAERLRPGLLTLAASADGVAPQIGFSVAAARPERDGR